MIVLSCSFVMAVISCILRLYFLYIFSVHSIQHPDHICSACCIITFLISLDSLECMIWWSSISLLYSISCSTGWRNASQSNGRLFSKYEKFYASQRNGRLFSKYENFSKVKKMGGVMGGPPPTSYLDIVRQRSTFSGIFRGRARAYMI